ncbi:MULTISPECIES: BlaI/MecI/CopY family transcriptional regulator [unclassified Leifsonia]|uniref:BlaI/MecI/CopY family transcriptional regulator n=1 Tax=unclassified Leifsonia TaxID=2663824 RepID=UPI0008A774F5|nr:MULTISPECIES: BlaI/MecI/CopY family transcriptional regulator [unclassified Leifsonia]SEH86630.1 Predicted transcriptional regulator [Leifsonia sp. CL154]SFL49069.1 Predicted transcriptional regulator [Leifsonia sp. CL147]
MANLGELERAVMDALWDGDAPITAGELRDRLTAARAGKAPALTTILTVLSRLEAKGFVARDRDARPHLYSAALTRAGHVADLMREVLESSSDRTEALAYFVGSVDESEAEVLRRLLDARSV